VTQLLLYENFSDIFCAALCRKKQLTKIVFYLKVDLGYLAMSVQYSFQVLCAPNNNVSIYLFWIKCFRCHLTSKKEPSPSEPLPRPVNKSSKFTNSNSCGNQFTYPFGMTFFLRDSGPFQFLVMCQALMLYENIAIDFKAKSSQPCSWFYCLLFSDWRIIIIIAIWV